MMDKDKDSLRAIAEEAAIWHIELEHGAPSLADTGKFINWLRRSPSHIEEFMRVSAAQSQLSKTPLAQLPDVQGLLEKARSNVIDLGEAQGEASKPVAARSKETVSRTQILGGLAAAIAIAAAVLLGLISSLPAPDAAAPTTATIYETTVGEQRSVLLDDGSVVNLNTMSRIDVRYSDEVRFAELTDGEAVFDVAENPERPFRVRAGTAIVEAVGTRFNVYRQREQTVVTVVDGIVAVSGPPRPTLLHLRQEVIPEQQSADNTVQLSTGNQVVVSSNGAVADTKPVDPRKATAWTERRLVFDGDALSTVVREVNRYNRTQVTIKDAWISDQAISGVFNANDPETLLAFLQAVGGLTVERSADGNGWTLSRGPTIPQDVERQPFQQSESKLN